MDLARARSSYYLELALSLVRDLKRGEYMTHKLRGICGCPNTGFSISQLWLSLQVPGVLTTTETSIGDGSRPPSSGGSRTTATKGRYYSAGGSTAGTMTLMRAVLKDNRQH